MNAHHPSSKNDKSNVATIEALQQLAKQAIEKNPEYLEHWQKNVVPGLAVICKYPAAVEKLKANLTLLASQHNPELVKQMQAKAEMFVKADRYMEFALGVPLALCGLVLIAIALLYGATKFSVGNANSTNLIGVAFLFGFGGILVEMGFRLTFKMRHPKTGMLSPQSWKIFATIFLMMMFASLFIAISKGDMAQAKTAAGFAVAIGLFYYYFSKRTAANLKNSSAKPRN